jgi:hypothetical protein
MEFFFIFSTNKFGSCNNLHILHNSSVFEIHNKQVSLSVSLPLYKVEYCDV